MPGAPKPRKGNRNATRRDRNARAEDAKWTARRAEKAAKAQGQAKRIPRAGRTAAAGPGRASGPKGLGGEQVEGRQAVRELLLGGRRVHELWLVDDDQGPLGDIAELASELRVPTKRVSFAKLNAASRSEAPQGVLARCAPLEEADLDVLLRRRPGHGAPFLVAVDGVTDPGNLGALIRSAECNGATGFVLPRHRAVHVTPTVAKAAAGAIEHVPMTLVGGLPAALERAKKAGVWVIGLDGGGDRRIDKVELAAEPVLLVLGAEGAGLSPLVRRRCDIVASIALGGRLGSLNVAAAGAIATYEVARRRLDAPAL
ncbi:MAG: 23S rRNA (guanosine(2251)-2'-O)-methyltransferase RlmB [Acidimicrobiales bacterium]